RPRLLPARRTGRATCRHAFGTRVASAARRQCQIFHRWRRRIATDSPRRAGAIYVYEFQPADVLALFPVGYSIGGKSQGKKGRRVQPRQRARLALERDLEETRIGRG